MLKVQSDTWSSAELEQLAAAITKNEATSANEKHWRLDITTTLVEKIAEASGNYRSVDAIRKRASALLSRDVLCKGILEMLVLFL